MKPLGVVERLPVMCEFEDGCETLELLQPVDANLVAMFGGNMLWADLEGNVYVGKDQPGYFIVRRKEVEGGTLLGELWPPFAE